MKSEYKIKSDRYGYIHTLRQVTMGDGRHLPFYELIPSEEWMTISVSMSEDQYDNKIVALDTDGGPCLTRGWSNGEIMIDNIELFGNYIFIKIKEL